MTIHIIPSEVACFGDAMRELDAKGIFRGDFILMNFDTITNAKIIPTIMKSHKENCKADKGTAMTVAYMVVAPSQRTGNEVLVAADKNTKRMLFHQRLHPTIKETKFKLPMEIFNECREFEIHHDYLDPHLAVCSPSALPLFSDNFDYETRDQFIRGLVMDQEFATDTIYVVELPGDEYAARVSDWKTYDMVSRDIINRWVYPLVPDMGISCLRPQYSFLRNNIYRNKNVKVQRDCMLKSDVVLQNGVAVDSKSSLMNCVLGKNCKIGKNCSIVNSYVFDGTIIGDNCKLENCVIGKNCKVKEGCTIDNGAVIAEYCVIEKNLNINGYLIQSKQIKDEYSTDDYEKIGEFAYKIKECNEDEDEFGSDTDLVTSAEVKQKFIKLSSHEPNYESSAYSSQNESEDEDEGQNFQQEDSAIFFSEVVESLKRGFDEKSNPDFLILEINSSRYAYNMALNEVNFYVVKATFNLPVVNESPEPVKGFLQVYNYLGEKVIKNYIKEDDSSQNDCLNAIIECCEENDKLKSKMMLIVRFLYDKDVLTEDGIVSWYEDVEMEWVKKSMQPMIKWLEEAESEDSDDD